MRINSDAWMDYLLSQSTPGYGNELSRVEPLFKKLHLGRLASTVITVTGTNGKGSVAKALEAIYLAAGYRVACITSPHLFTIHERLTLSGKNVTETSVQESFSHVESCRDQDTPINYFDFIHLAWFYLITHFKPDIAICEVGCGGRLDITNLLDSDACIMTSVDLDHTEMLGDTRELIALEKAHLARNGCPFVCGERQIPQGLVSFVKKTIGAQFYGITHDFGATVRENSWDFFSTAAKIFDLPIPSIMLENAMLAVEAVQLLQHQKPVNETAIQRGLQNTRLPGRFEQLVVSQVTIIFDVAHNPHAARRLSEQLKAHPVKGKTVALFGMMRRKDLYRTIKALQSAIDVWYPATLNQKDSYLADEIGEYMQAVGIKNWYTTNSFSCQLKNLLRSLTGNDRLVIFGSFYAVSEAKMVIDSEISQGEIVSDSLAET